MRVHYYYINQRSTGEPYTLHYVYSSRTARSHRQWIKGPADYDSIILSIIGTKHNASIIGSVKNINNYNYYKDRYTLIEHSLFFDTSEYTLIEQSDFKHNFT